MSTPVATISVIKILVPVIQMSVYSLDFQIISVDEYWSKVLVQMIDIKR